MKLERSASVTRPTNISVRQRHLLRGDVRERPRLRRGPWRRPQLLQLQLGGRLRQQDLRRHPHLVTW
jgi:hypothetical protein